MAGKNGRPYKYSRQDGRLDIDKIETLIEDYFTSHDTYSVPGLRVHLDITKDTMALWQLGYTHEPIDDDDASKLYNGALSSAIKKALDRIEQYLIETDGKGRNLKDMAALNASFGYRQDSKQDININANIRFDLADVDKYSN